MNTPSSSSNPFFNRHRISEPRYFSGRQRELESLYSAVLTRQCRSVVGERKLGKSSLMTQLKHPQVMRSHGLDPEEYICLYIDLEGMVAITADQFWPEILDRLEMELPQSQDRLATMAGDLAMAPNLSFIQVRRFLRRLDRAGITLVLMFDEFECLATNRAFDVGFYGQLRSLAGELGVVYITASKRSLYDLTYEHKNTLSSPFFNIFSEIQLSLMPQEEATQLLRDLSSLGDAPPFSEGDIGQLVALAGPHPFFLQIIAYHAYARREEGDLDSEAIAQVTRRFRAEAEDHYRYLWSQLDEDAQFALMDLDAADAATRKDLQRKALARETDSGFEPFSQTFAAFLGRTEPLKRPERRDTGDLTGTTLGSYRVLNRIGAGGMAVVYKGYQPSLDRYVAIKVMSRNLGDDQSFVDRFHREAAGVAKLRHQNIVQVYDFNARDDILYMVMEYIDGDTLKASLLARRDRGEIYSFREAVQVINDIASALDYAHAHGIVHRDVKPANIMLRSEERLAKFAGGSDYSAVLTDFGIARMLEGVQLTNPGATVGTPDYMSPEQARGDPAEAASDVYALAIVLYEMLTGELPFHADTPVAVLIQHMHEEPPSIREKVSDLPSELDDVIRRAMAKDPVERFPTAGALAIEFTRILEYHT